jgi:hypothetical protein
VPNDDASAALDRGADPAEQVRLGPLIEPLEALRRGERPHAGEQASVREAIDTIMLGAPPRYGWRRFLELTDSTSTRRATTGGRSASPTSGTMRPRSPTTTSTAPN